MIVDSNIIIYACLPEYDELRQLIAELSPSVSIMSKVETLGYHRFAEGEYEALEAFFEAAHAYPVTSAIVEQAIALRQQQSLSLGDSLIAGTALVHQETLMTRNVDDFAWIDGLNLLNPFGSEQDNGE